MSFADFVQSETKPTAEVSTGLTVTQDLDTCPQCDAPRVKTTLTQRQCNRCGLIWTLVSEADEQERKNQPKAREFALQRGNVKAIGRYQRQW
jgi:ribosomal protein L37AE/L43A